MYADGAPKLRLELLELGIPVLGICYGMQAMVLELGGRVEGAPVGEFGRSQLDGARATAGCWRACPHEQACWMSHRDTVFEAPPGFTPLASSTESPVAAFEDADRGLYGIQFHPEVVHTPYGTADPRALPRATSAAATCTWIAASVVEEQVARIREQVGDGRVICGLSGGVDSSVAALLVHRAIGDQLTCVFVDHGLMRKNEGDQVVAAFRDHFQVPLVRGRRRGALPRAARRPSPSPRPSARSSAREFIRVFEEEAAKLGNPRYLVQGTLYSDVIESGGGTRRGHDQVAPQRRRPARGPPVRARRAAAHAVQGRGPPGRPRARPARAARLAPAVPGARASPSASSAARSTKERLEILRDADFILQDEIRSAGLYRELWQSFCVLPGDLRTVGVQGDERTYGYVVVIRAVTSDDAMTADWARLPYDLLEKIASRMINEIRQVNRVVLDITSKPPGTIEWE